MKTQKNTDIKNKWPNEVRLQMIEKSKLYPGQMNVYQYGYYDGFQKAIEYLQSLNEEK